jgi:hypothetical protein
VTDGTTQRYRDNGTLLTWNRQTITVPNGVVNITAAGVTTFTPALNQWNPQRSRGVNTDGTLTSTANQVITVTPDATGILNGVVYADTER